ncbi:MAG: Na(+)/H(+) antiporter subunit D [Planctomycetota bacterium]|nr:Na(+)/H(+) antiporter subunit D [Planctomycetota bacterium]
MIESFPPGTLLILGALLVPFMRGRLLAAYMLSLPVLGLAQVWALDPGTTATLQLFGYELNFLRVDKLSKVFGYIFHIAAFLSVIYALHLKDRVQHGAGLIYAGAAIAAVFAGDLISLFVFWELTAISSVFLIWASKTESAYRSGMRYLIIQVGSGVLLLAGTILHYENTGSLDFVGLAGNDLPSLADAGLGVQLIFLAFGIKAAFPLLHSWLQNAYPEATVTGTVFLSAFTTKLAIYALARGFAGTEILIPIGAAMTAFPIFYAVIENDLRKVLAYSLNNQLGFMVVGIGIGTEMAINGTASHAFAHILYKGLLFMSMGAVLFRTGTCKGSELGGLYKSMPWTAFFCCIGAASISAFPLFSGFVTKSLVVGEAAHGDYTVTFLILLFASAGVFHHSGIKIPYFAFFGHDSGRRVKEAPFNMLLAMGGAAFLCVAVGVFYQPLYDILPFPVDPDYEPYSTTHWVTQLQLLLFSAAAFVFLQKTRLYPPELRSTNIDVEWTYRKGLPAVVRQLGRAIAGVDDAVRAKVCKLVGGAAHKARAHHAPSTGILGEPWTVGRTALWAAILLIVCLLMAFA